MPDHRNVYDPDILTASGHRVHPTIARGIDHDTLSICTGTDSTVSGTPGAGLTIDRLLGVGGRRLENLLNSLSRPTRQAALAEGNTDGEPERMRSGKRRWFQRSRGGSSAQPPATIRTPGPEEPLSPRPEPLVIKLLPPSVGTSPIYCSRVSSGIVSWTMSVTSAQVSLHNAEVILFRMRLRTLDVSDTSGCVTTTPKHAVKDVRYHKHIPIAATKLSVANTQNGRVEPWRMHVYLSTHAYDIPTPFTGLPDAPALLNASWTSRTVYDTLPPPVRPRHYLSQRRALSTLYPISPPPVHPLPPLPLSGMSVESTEHLSSSRRAQRRKGARLNFTDTLGHIEELDDVDDLTERAPTPEIASTSDYLHL